MKHALVTVLSSVLLLGQTTAVHAQARPALWFEGIGDTPRDKEIHTKVMKRLGVAFDVKTTITDPSPRMGVQVSLYTQGVNTALAVVLVSPRPPISLYRSGFAGACNGTSSDVCADVIVNAIYARASVWNTVPAYPAGS